MRKAERSWSLCGRIKQQKWLGTAGLWKPLGMPGGKIWILLGFIMMVLVFTGCGKGPAKEPETRIGTVPDKNLIVVGVSQIGSESVWRTAN
ncbi:MAG: hypothetical protein HFG57_09465, partial [Lachnospiraceae bacterium]|nr:hypothetical protein [Lachnospiraceae bacterium]